eukprot:COSAG03_NODE_405_length_8175_cov_4.098935_8_plen_70_part_00
MTLNFSEEFLFIRVLRLKRERDLHSVPPVAWVRMGMRHGMRVLTRALAHIPHRTAMLGWGAILARMERR